jgi:hypothetical protein
MIKTHVCFEVQIKAYNLEHNINEELIDEAQQHRVGRAMHGMVRYGRDGLAARASETGNHTFLQSNKQAGNN